MYSMHVLWIRMTDLCDVSSIYHYLLLLAQIGQHNIAGNEMISSLTSQSEITMFQSIKYLLATIMCKTDIA